ncbi:hypothetical protein [Streptomyces apricus]|uniref:Uncharacterized protein n=1 Tax=Streptomyces apricus TaxID=1828112 RepID=A0A5B0ASW5_9ACTN|nr:hypothetical protein [Streptomyces apricus]KAA0931599.1 hypothetical protein FGF04_22025 [Streptomyces apricus]
MRLGKALATGVAEEQPYGTDEGHRPDGAAVGDEAPEAAARPVRREPVRSAPAAEEAPSAR